jgi:predicted dehydrogenase
MLKFLIVGFGSIGKRHFDNLMQIQGVEVSILSRRQITQHGARVYNSLDQALNDEFDAVFIANETALHISTAIAFAERGRHLFIEKPLSHNLEDVDKLTNLVGEYNLKLMIGNNMRFHPVVKFGKELIEKSRIGRIVSARLEVGEYLPDWRPERDFKSSYSASIEGGGGVILDLSHELDYAYWFFGDPVKIFSVYGKRSNLPIEAEDIAGILIEFRSGAWCQVHLDYIQRHPCRTFKLIGTEGIMQADLNDNKLMVSTAGRPEWEIVDTGGDFQRNRMYVEELRHFIDYLNGKVIKPQVGLEDGIKVLQIVQAAKESSRLGRFIQI